MTQSPHTVQHPTHLANDRWHYDFHCPACGSCGPLSTPDKEGKFRCPEYIERIRGTCTAEFKQLRADPARAPIIVCLNEADARWDIRQGTVKKDYESDFGAFDYKFRRFNG